MNQANDGEVNGRIYYPGKLVLRQHNDYVFIVVSTFSDVSIDDYASALWLDSYVNDDGTLIFETSEG